MSDSYLVYDFLPINPVVEQDVCPLTGLLQYYSAEQPDVSTMSLVQSYSIDPAIIPGLSDTVANLIGFEPVPGPSVYLPRYVLNEVRPVMRRGGSISYSARPRKSEDILAAAVVSQSSVSMLAE